MSALKSAPLLIEVIASRREAVPSSELGASRSSFVEVTVMTAGASRSSRGSTCGRQRLAGAGLRGERWIGGASGRRARCHQGDDMVLLLGVEVGSRVGCGLAVCRGPAGLPEPARGTPKGETLPGRAFSVRVTEAPVRTDEDLHICAEALIIQRKISSP